MTVQGQREAVGQDSAFEVRLELVLDELRLVGAGLTLSLREEGGGVLLHPAVQRGLFRAVALEVDGGPSGARWGCWPTVCTKGSRSGGLARSQALYSCVLSAPIAAHPWLPASVGPRSGNRPFYCFRRSVVQPSCHEAALHHRRLMAVMESLSTAIMRRPQL